MKYFLLLILLLSSQLSYSQTKRALIIGLGEQQDTSWGKINGDKDVSYVKNMLVPSGFTDITTLVNREATKDAIVKEFNSLAKRAKLDDVIYIHYSGHGQQMTDLNKDEKDRYDESWIPYDAFRRYCSNDKGNKHLCDDEIAYLLTSIRNRIGLNGKIIVVVDACHSGDSSKEITNDVDQEYNTTVIPSDETDYVVRGVIDRFIIPQGNASLPVKRYDESWITISACESYQLNLELKNPQVGRLTYALYNIWKQNNALTNNQLLEALTEKMNQGKSVRIKQSPKITGKIHVTNILQTIK